MEEEVNNTERIIIKCIFSSSYFGNLILVGFGQKKTDRLFP